MLKNSLCFQISSENSRILKRILTELCCEKFEWFDPSPIEPFNSGKNEWRLITSPYASVSSSFRRFEGRSLRIAFHLNHFRTWTWSCSLPNAWYWMHVRNLRTGLNYSFGTNKYCHQIRITEFSQFFLQFFCNSQRILTFSHTSMKLSTFRSKITVVMSNLRKFE